MGMEVGDAVGPRLAGQAEAIQAMRPAREAKWAWKWVMPSARAWRASSTAWATSSPGSVARTGRICAKRSRSESWTRPWASWAHMSMAFRGRGTQVTRARTRAISGWKRESVVGRSA